MTRAEDCVFCEDARSCPEHNPSRACGCVSGEFCVQCGFLAFALLWVQNFWERLLRKAEHTAQSDALAFGDAGAWAARIAEDTERLGFWRSLFPVLLVS